MSERFYLMNGWRFNECFSEEHMHKEFDDSGFKEVRLPHTVKETPYNYFDESIYSMVSSYRKTFIPPNEWKGKSIRLTFEGVAHESTLYINGEEILTHRCGYTAFTADLSEKLIYGEQNLISLRVDSNENLNQPPFGFVIDYMTYGGIYRDVYFSVSDKCHIEDVFLYPDFTGDDVKLGIETGLSEECLGKLEELEITAYIDGREFASFGLRGLKESRKLNPGKVELWDVSSPKLYDIKLSLHKKGDADPIDETVVRFGFRKSEFKDGKYFLNDKELRIRGLNRHQSFPYVGYAMPASVQEEDARILKEELGLNAVRTSHYPQAQSFISKCDELGLLVFTEIPGWQHIGDEVWKEQAITNVRDMVLPYRNHPSIILWGVRINESVDDDDFYRKTNEAARSLDPTRPTGGVRATKNSSFLEDVYTYNDFVHDGTNEGCEPKAKVTPDVNRPYLISEYNGHMYPTKSFDSEEIRREHALRHANVLNAVAGQEDIAGSFGWCMADYNTHKEFGSGDRICYHGVLDMFRNMKPAAYIYGALSDKQDVLYLSSSMDIGEHPACNRGKIWIISNADRVRMYKNKCFIKEYSQKDSPYKNLSHGPIAIDDFIGDAIEKGEAGTDKYKALLKEFLNMVAVYGMGHAPKHMYVLMAKLVIFHRTNPSNLISLFNKYVGNWGDASTEYMFEAIKDGKVVKTLVKKPSAGLHLEVIVSKRELIERESYDVSSVRIQAVDENGNVASFFGEPVSLETSGSIEIIGPKLIGLKGGMAGTYIKSTGAGEGKLVISNYQCENVSVDFSVKKVLEF
ncbi:MAG: glycoside hydrolase family 2 protein [Lachnospiraceae bacterium]|nr:glycoside hydrolase family 2 protein [Lachnospiraceae bacterium]